MGVEVATDATGDYITIKNSEFSHCGYPSKPCIVVSANHLTVTRNTFTECEHCNWLKGGATNVVVTDNYFGSIYKRPGCTGASCGHLDSIHIEGQGPWTIARNTFTDCGHKPSGELKYDGACTANIFLGDLAADEGGPGSLHDVQILNNKFFGQSSVGIDFKNHGPNMPKKHLVKNNTCVGASWTQTKPCVGFSGGWPIPPVTDDSPRIVNNVFAFINDNTCNRSFHATNWSINIAGGSAVCDERGGDAGLDPSGNGDPLATSGLIGAATAAEAPADDFYALKRDAQPDIGAVEYRPVVFSTNSGIGSADPSVSLPSEPADGDLLVFSIAIFQTLGWGDSSVPNFTCGQGWTPIEEAVNSGYIRQERCYHFAEPGDPATFSPGTLSASALAWAAIIAEYKGASALGAQSTPQTGNTPNPDSGSVAAVGALHVAALANAGTGAQTNPTDGFTQRACIAKTNGIATVQECLYDKIALPSTAHVRATLPGSARWAGAVATFR